MPGELEINPSNRYLLCNYFFPDAMIEKVKEDVKTFMTDRVKDSQYFQFINWKRAKKEMAVLTMYAYADIGLPKQFDTVFQVDKPDNFVHAELVVTQAVINGWTTGNKIDYGHKHILIIQFAYSVPSIFNLLSSITDSEHTQNQIQLGFCNKVDFDSIKGEMKQHQA